MSNTETIDVPRGRTLEAELTCYLLLVAGIFFLLEALVHYEDFFVTTKADNPVSATLVIGCLVVGLVYFLLSYSCWNNPKDLGFFGFATVMSAALSGAYFVLAIVEFAGSSFYFHTFFTYMQFLSGYGSVTIFVELLISFFSFRVYRSISEA